MKNIIVEKKNRIGIVTVNRPNELNSMNSETRKELAIAFEELDLDDEVNVSILTGTPGKAFIAGADIKEFSKMEINLKFPEKHGSTTMRIHSKVLSQ